MPKKKDARLAWRRRSITMSGVFVLILMIAFGAITFFPNSFERWFLFGSAPPGGHSAEAFSSNQIYPLPKSNPPASNFYVTSTGGQGDPMSYTMAALAGLVARDKPQLFLVQASGDQTWLSYIEKNYAMQGMAISNTQALSRFASYIEDNQSKVQIIEYDPNDPFFPMQVNMAATLAGVYSAIPVATTEMSTIDSVFGASNVNVRYNLTAMFTGTNESTVKVEAYSWLWNLTSAQTTRAFFSMNPEGRPDLDDYVVEFKAFQFEFCCVNMNAIGNKAPPLTTDELNFVSNVLGNYPPNTDDVGYIGLGSEGYTIQILSQFGMSEIADPELSDLSFYSGFPTLTNLNQAPSSQTFVSYNPSQSYVFFEFTQGDALTFDAFTNWHLYNAVDSSTGVPYRNEVPAAWQINPVMAVIAPPIMQAYYSEQQGSLDDFIPGPSGGSGYNHPDQMGQYEAAQNALSQRVSANAGIGLSFVIFGNAFSQSVEQTFVQQAQPKAVLLWQNSGHAPSMVNGVPFLTSTFWLGVGSSYSSSDVSSTVAKIQNYASSSHFIYVILNAQNPGLPFVSQVMNGLGSNYQAVNAEQYVSLYCQSQKQSSCSDSATHSSTTTSSNTHASSTTSTTTSSTATETSASTVTQTSTYTSVTTQVDTVTSSNSTFTFTQTGTTAFERTFTRTIQVSNGSTSTIQSTTSGVSNSNAQIQTQNALEGQKVKTVAGTLALGTGAEVFLVGLFPLLYFTQKGGKKLKSRNIPLFRGSAC